ncbi:MAG: ribosomal protein S18-alanine N-acetyltransferase [Deltaproteobacteria bacterium]|nr:ribosomal protein S18-alanine N-acetyltransferase [Deltaproteobacteria bacterium]
MRKITEPESFTSPTLEARGLKFRRLVVQDVSRTLALERLCYKNAWTADNFIGELDSTIGFNFGIFYDHTLLAMAITWLIDPESHLLNLAVHPQVRRQGLGRELLTTTAQCAKSLGATVMHLEVAVGNRAAQTLYKNMGFKTVGFRNNYYQEGGDAILMNLNLNNLLRSTPKPGTL